MLGIEVAAMGRPPRIGYLVQQFWPEVGAGPARVGEMALHWKRAGAEVTIFTAMPNRPEGRIYSGYRGKAFMEERWEGIRVLRSWLYASPRHGSTRTILNNFTFLLTSSANATLRSGGIDVLIASSPPFFPHIAGALLTATRRIPLVLEVRDLWPDYMLDMGVLRRDSLPARALLGLERRLLKRAAHVVVVTDSFRRRIVEKGVAPDLITVVPNGVELDRYCRAAEAPAVPELVRRGDELIVGYLGNFGAAQALPAVLDAAAVLAGDARVRFVLAGDGTERAGVLQRAEELRLPNVAILGALPKEQTRAFYNACDVCLVPLASFPVLQETVPSKLFEVMACERPVLASVGGEAARIVDRSGAGIVCAPGDAAAIAAGVLRLLETPLPERARMGARGRAYVMRHFNRESNAARYLDVLGKVAGVSAAAERAR